MSPEVCESKPYTYKSDIWALGCVLYELCTLKHAFDSNNLLGLVIKIVKEKVDAIPSSYSKELQQIINALLSKNGNDRPTIKELFYKPYIQKIIKEFIDTNGGKCKENIPIKKTMTHTEIQKLLK